MTAYHYLYLVLIGLVIIGWGSRVYAEENVTIYGETPSSSTSSSTSASSSTASDTANTSTTHHKKKKKPVPEDATETAAASTAPPHTTSTAKKKLASHHGTPSSVTPFVAPPGTPPPATFSAAVTTPSASTQTGAITVTKSTPTSQTQITISAPPVPPPPPVGASDKPEVETGLPVARPGSKSYSPGLSSGGGVSRGNYPASIFPLPGIPVTSAAGSYVHDKNALGDFPFTDFEHRARTYPWKTNIVTTIFWIGEGSTPISSTDNVASAWDEDWRANNNGTDTPDARDGYFPAHHGATINPFYVALPFNDLAFPEKARRWLPSGWYRPPRDGKQVSACQHRWVEIKNAQGEICYAQWEDVGPLRYDHAEYVFGSDRPDTYTSGGLDRAGLDVSPAVAQYLSINGKNQITSWRFVDDADVKPGKWLQYDEEAVLFKAIRANKDLLPIERARAPIDDPDEIDSSQKKLNKAKG
jgi:hypothetical protein